MPAAAARSEGDDYPAARKVVAFVFTLAVPIMTLIAALHLMSRQDDPVRHATLRVWAWLSGILCAIGLLVLLALIVASVSR